MRSYLSGLYNFLELLDRATKINCGTWANYRFRPPDDVTWVDLRWWSSTQNHENFEISKTTLMNTLILYPSFDVIRFEKFYLKVYFFIVFYRESGYLSLATALATLVVIKKITIGYHMITKNLHFFR